MASLGVAAPNCKCPREQRALKLYREHGDEIEQVASNLYWVPGQDGRCEYVLRYPVAVGEQESCSCRDHQLRGATCVHVLAVAIHCAKKRAQRRRNYIASFAAAAAEEEDV